MGLRLARLGKIASTASPLISPPPQDTTSFSTTDWSSRTFPGPVVGLEPGQSVRREPTSRLPRRRTACQEMLGEHADVPLAVPKGRDPDDPMGEAIEQILPKPPFPHPFVEIGVRGGHDPNVGLSHASLADPLVVALLEKAKELHLREPRKIGDLVQKERAALRLARRTRLCRRQRE